MSPVGWKRSAVLLLLCSSLARIEVILGQATVTIAVGQFFDPRTVNAFVGDVVEFVFESGTHGVVQSTNTTPCSQIAGGFNSGLVPGFAPNATSQSPIWQLTVTDATDPIFFYCPALTPSFHCSNGMVGGINIANDVFSSFSSAAKSISGTPTQTNSVVLTGVGATASASPTILAQTPGFVPTSAPSSATPTSSATTSSSSSTPTPAPVAKSSSSKGAAIGGGIGAAVAVSIIGVLLYLLFRKRQNSQQSAPSWHGSEMGRKPDIFSDTAYSRGTVFSDKSDPAGALNNVPGLPYGQSQGQMYSSNQSPPVSAFSAQQEFPTTGNVFARDVGYPSFPQPSPPPQNISLAGPSNDPERYGQVNEATALQPNRASPAMNQGVDVQMIAKEVAALLVPHITNANARDNSTDSPTASLPSLPNPHENTVQKLSRRMSPAPEYSTLSTSMHQI